MVVSVRRRVSTVAIATALVAAATACSSTSTPAPSSTAAAPTSGTSSSRIDVVASTNVWGDIVKQIGGDHVNVVSIMSDPNADPHEYQADANTAAALAKSQLVIENGLGYDDFMDKLLSASPNPALADQRRRRDEVQWSGYESAHLV